MEDVIDRAAREAVEMNLEGYLDGHITNFKLDEVINTLETKDRLCQEIASQCWFFYDDLKLHFNSETHRLPDSWEQMARRWIFLLRNNMDHLHVCDHELNATHSDTVKVSIVKNLCVMFSSEKSKFMGNYFWPLRDADHWDELQSSHKINY